MVEFSDTKEQIDKASKASGARGMLTDLANKMRNGVKSLSLEDFYVKSISDIPGAKLKAIAALNDYAEKVKAKKMYYITNEKQWFQFGEEERVEEELYKIERNILRLKEKSYDVQTYNLTIQFSLKNMIMGSIEG